MESYPCMWIGRRNIVKMSVFLNVIYRFNTSPTKIPASYFTDINKLVLKFIGRGRRPRTASTVVEKKDKAAGLTLSNFKTHSYSNGDSMVLNQERTKQTNKQNRGPKTDPQNYSQLISAKGVKPIQWRKNNQQMLLKQLDICMEKYTPQPHITTSIL